MPTQTVYTTSFRGIGPLTERELQRQQGIGKGATETHSVRDYDIVLFSTDSASDLVTLRTTEDVFYELGRVELTGHRADTERIEDLLTAAPVEVAINTKRDFTPKTRPGRPTYRIIVQAEDAPWRSYRREQLEEAGARAVGSRYRKWRRVDDDSHIEFWIHLLDRTALVGLRLTVRSMLLLED